MATDTLSPAQTAAVTALLAGETHQGAADSAGVSKSTLYRWLREQDFNDAIRQEQRRTWEAVGRALTSKGLDAVEKLASITKDEGKPAAARVAAAKAILEMIFRLRDSDIEGRLEALERAAGVAGGRELP